MVRGECGAKAVWLGSMLVFGVFGGTAGAFGQIVINEIMYDPNPPNSSNAEWFELYNAGNAQVDLDGWTVKDNGSDSFTISGQLLIGAGDYLVLGEISTNNGGVTLDYDYPDAFALSNGEDEIILLDATSPTPVEQDRVFYDINPWPVGNGAALALKSPELDNNDRENWCVATTPYGTGALGTPGAANDCAAGPATFSGAIYEIQGSGAASPELNALATTENNVVTAVGAGGFFIQTPSADSDNDPDTSDGIFVLYDGMLTVAVGDQVDVTGTVEESFGFTRMNATGADASVTVDASNQPLPPPVEFGATRPSPDPASPTCAIEYECYEGMRIRVASGTISAASQAFRSDPLAEMYVTPTATRAFREKGVRYPGLSSHPSVPVWDGNPELFELDPDKLGLPNVSWVPGTTFSATGVLGYEFSGYELWATELRPLRLQPPLPHPARGRRAGEVSVASLNMLNLDKGATSYGTKRDKLSQYVREVLRSPDIVGVQEVYSLATLQGLAEEIRRDDPSVRYTAYLEVGNRDPGINVGFLVRSGITVRAVSQHGKAETYLNPSTNMNDLLHDRPPLQLDASVGGLDFSVVVVHNRSLIDIGTERVQAKRLAQAQSVAGLAQSLQSRKLIVLGDFNAFQFTDGYVDVMGQITGSVTPSENVASGPDLVDPNLTNLIDRVPAAQRYSYVFRNSAQALDHALVNAALLDSVVGIQYARGNADAREAKEADIDSPLRASDHDGLVVYLSVPGRPAPDEGGGGPPGVGGPPGGGEESEADLGLSAAIRTLAGGGLRVVVRVENEGPGRAPGVVVRSSVGGAAVSPVTSGCGEDPAGVPECSLGAIEADASVSFTIDVASIRSDAGALGYTGSVTSDVADPRPGDERVTVSHPVGTPGPPTGLVARAIGPTEIELRWKDNSSIETEFAVYQQGPGDSRLRLIGTAPANSTSTVVTDLVPNVTYRFAVEARNGPLSSERTPKVVATTWTIETSHCGEGDYLCLGRFQVEVAWEDGDGRTGRGVAERLTARSGDFWFFEPANVELVVKILDGCAINGHYWVYAVGLTDVAVTMTVRDLRSGSPFAGVATSVGEKSWSSAAGARFGPIADQAAFATCDTAAAAAHRGGSVLSGASPGRFDELGRKAPRSGLENSLAASDGFVSAASAGCSQSDTALCLRDGRYEARADWRVGEESGAARGAARTADTGMFWFFGPDNVEIVLKVLDGCAINGHRWLLMGGLTDVAVDVFVTDGETGQAKTYGSPGGAPFPTTFDLTAFSCSDGP